MPERPFDPAGLTGNNVCVGRRGHVGGALRPSGGENIERRNMTRKLVAAMSTLLLLAPSGAANETAKLIEMTIDGAKNDADRAERLVAAAANLGDSSKVQEAFYNKALEYGARTPRGCPQALAAIEALIKLAPDRADELLAQRLAVMRLQYRGARDSSARKAAGKPLMGALVGLADAKVAGRRAVEAVKLYREAIGIAAFLRSDHKAEIAGKLRSAQTRAVVEQKLTALRAVVDKAPGDADARTRLILFHVQELNDPAGAQKHLTEDIDEALRTYVPLAAKPVEQVAPAVCLELGQWYYHQVPGASAAGKRIALTRAMRYHERYLGETKDTDTKHAKAKLALDKIEKELNKFGSSVTIHWTVADDADVYLNGKPLREYKPDFRSRRDEAYKRFSAKARLGVGDVFTVGGRRGGSYGFLLVALDKQGRTVWQTDTRNWRAYVPGDEKKWYLPSVAAGSRKTKVTVNPRPWHIQNTMRRELRVKAQSIWPGPSSRRAYLVSVVR